jgi:hypothetical protein
MKKILIFLGIIVVLVLGVIFISAQELAGEIGVEVQEVVDQVSTGDISTDVYEYVSNFVQKREILPSEISFVREVDFDSLPKEVNIENVGDSNLAIYEISYNESGVEDEIYVITYSVEELKAQGDLIIAHDRRQFLNFGFDGSMSESGFLDTATGVEGSLEKGYVMVRDGSITAVSTNLEVTQDNPGQIEIIVYRNGQAVGFGNTLDTDLTGVKSDYDVQSRDTVVFEAGDVISVYVRGQGDIVWKDVITMVEITTIN